MTKQRVGVTSKLNAISPLEIHYANVLWVELATIFPIAEEAYPIRIKPHPLAHRLGNTEFPVLGLVRSLPKRIYTYTAANDLIVVALTNRADITFVQIGRRELILDQFIQHK